MDTSLSPIATCTSLTGVRREEEGGLPVVVLLSASSPADEGGFPVSDDDILSGADVFSPAVVAGSDLECSPVPLASVLPPLVVMVAPAEVVPLVVLLLLEPAALLVDFPFRLDPALAAPLLGLWDPGGALVTAGGLLWTAWVEPCCAFDNAFFVAFGFEAAVLAALVMAGPNCLTVLPAVLPPAGLAGFGFLPSFPKVFFFLAAFLAGPLVVDRATVVGGLFWPGGALVLVALGGREAGLKFCIGGARPTFLAFFGLVGEGGADEMLN